MKFRDPFLDLSFQTKGWITLVSGFFLHFILGVFYLWGSISTYTTSYIQHYGADKFTKDIVGAVFPFTFLAINIGNPFGISLANYFGWKKFIFGASTLCGLSVIISSLNVSNFYFFVTFYGVIFGLLVGVLYMVPFDTCYKYFPHRKGLVSGVITAGFGFGSTVFIWLIYGIVNPNNKTPTFEVNGVYYFEKEVIDQFPVSLQILGSVMIGIGCISSFFHIRPLEQEVEQFQFKLKEKEEEKKKGVETEKEKEEKQHNLKENGTQNQYLEKSSCSTTAPQKFIEKKNIFQRFVVFYKKKNEKQEYLEFQSFKNAAKTKFIYISTLLTFLFAVYGTMIVSQYKNYGELKKYEDNFLSIVGTVGSVMNGCARIFWGYLMEKFTILQLIIVNVSLQIIVSFTFSWASEEKILFFIYVVGGCFLYGAWLAIMPALINRIYGKKVGSTIYAFTFFGFVSASFFQYFIVVLLKNEIGWQYTFWIFSVIQILSLILSFFVNFNAILHNQFEDIILQQQQPKVDKIIEIVHETQEQSKENQNLEIAIQPPMSESKVIEQSQNYPEP